jgi:hypothetical protein
MTAQLSVFNSQPSIQLRIEGLVLDGFSPGDRYRIAEAMQGELAQLLADPITRASLAAPRETAQLGGGSFRVAANSKPEAIGVQVAQSLQRGLEQ